MLQAIHTQESRKKENNYTFVDGQNLNLSIRALIVTGDGDFYCLAKHLLEKSKLKAMIVPNRLKFSGLLKFKVFRPYLRFLNDLEQKLGYNKKKRPYEDKPS